MERRRSLRAKISLGILLVLAIQESNVTSDYIDSPVEAPGQEFEEIPVEYDSQVIPIDVLWEQNSQISDQPIVNTDQIEAEPVLIKWKGNECYEDPSKCSKLAQGRYGYGGFPGHGGHGGFPGHGGHGGFPGHGGHGGHHGLGVGLGLETTLGLSGWGVPFIRKKATFGWKGHGWKYEGPKPYSFPYHFHSLSKPTGNIYYEGNKYYSGSHCTPRKIRRKKKRGKGKQKKGDKGKKKKGGKGKKKKKKSDVCRKSTKYHLKPIVHHSPYDDEDDDDDDDSGWERTLPLARRRPIFRLPPRYF